jgi:hypothetical protein
VGLDVAGIGLGRGHHRVAWRARLAHDVGDPGVEVAADERREDLADLGAHGAPGAAHAGEGEDLGCRHGSEPTIFF